MEIRWYDSSEGRVLPSNFFTNKYIASKFAYDDFLIIANKSNNKWYYLNNSVTGKLQH